MKTGSIVKFNVKITLKKFLVGKEEQVSRVAGASAKVCQIMFDQESRSSQIY